MVEQTTGHQGESEDTVNVVIFDSFNYPSPPKRVEVTFSKSLTTEAFINKISEDFSYPKEALEAKWKNGPSNMDPEDQKTLKDMGFGRREVVHLSKRKDVEIKGKVPNMMAAGSYENSKSVIGSSSSSSSSSSYSYSTYPPSSPTSQALVPTTYGPSLPSSTYTYPSTGYTSSYSYSWSQSAGKSSTGYVGLSNQGATCYMNSLIQSLFMTPEFRNALYNWSFDEKYKSEAEKAKAKEKENGSGEKVNGSGKNLENGNGVSSPSLSSQDEKDKTEREKKERTSIPLQLQRLFARLQLSDVQAVKTKDLTKSFGWEDSDAFTQHDVQELCRVLFDALEKNFQGTKQSNLVNELYQGKMKDYVQCKECKHESARVDHYLDIPLVIRGFGETIPVKSVEEALHKFIQPEVLDKENQYNCEKCAKKVDAIKGLKIEKLPYLLTLQLKRFDFDLQTMRRVKLNDRVTFPLYLDLNPIISGNKAPTQQSQEKHHQDESDESEEEREDKGKNKARVEEDEPRPQPRDGVLVDLDDDDDNCVPNYHHSSASDAFNAEPDFDAPPPIVTPELPYVYELFSVMIHRGSSMGGHYYAYVKSFDTGKWYDFNDSSVSEINVSEVKKAFGGDEEGGSYGSRMYSSYRSTANAYMLMYRQIDTERNKKPLTAEELPENIKRIVDDENGAAKQKKKAEELEREMVKLKIFYNGDEKPLSMHKTASLNDTAKASANLFGITDRYTYGNYRLRYYSNYNDLPGDTYTGKESKSLEDLGFYAHSYSVKSFLLETKEVKEEFEEYNPGNVLFRVAKYNPQTLGFDSVVNVYVSKYGTFGDLKEAVENKVGVPKDKMNLYREPTYNSWHAPPATLLDALDDVDLRSLHVMEPEKLYVEYSENPAGGSQDSDSEEEDDDDNKDREYDHEIKIKKLKQKEREESPVIAALERIKNIIEIKFNLPGKDEFDQKINVDKNMLLKDFKEKIQPTVGLPLDDFKIKRGNSPHLYELINDTESLNDVSVRDGMSLTIEKGKPLKEGETNFAFELFDISKDSENFSDLFELPVHEDALVSDVKQAIFPLLHQKGIAVNDPKNIRLREISSLPSRKVGKVFPDNQTVKKAMVYVYSKRMLVQILDHPEIETQEKDLFFFVQQFKPESFELTKKVDFVISEDASLEELRARLGELYSIPAPNVGILRVDSFFSFNEDPELLEVPEMSWDRPTIAYSNKNTVGDTMMMRNGNLMLVRDNTAKLKELTKEETDAIKKDTMKKKASSGSSTSSYSFWNRKEKALKIQSDD